MRARSGVPFNGAFRSYSQVSLNNVVCGILWKSMIKRYQRVLDPSLPRTSKHGLRLPVCGQTFKHNSIQIGGGLNYDRHFELAAMNGTPLNSPTFLSLPSNFFRWQLIRNGKHWAFVGLFSQLAAAQFCFCVQGISNTATIISLFGTCHGGLFKLIFFSNDFPHL